MTIRHDVELRCDACQRESLASYSHPTPRCLACGGALRIVVMHDHVLTMNEITALGPQGAQTVSPPCSSQRLQAIWRAHARYTQTRDMQAAAVMIDAVPDLLGELTRREAERDTLRVMLTTALCDALHLADVPEHDQDAAWHEERERLSEEWNAAFERLRSDQGENQ
jgi:hypothetical protein